MENGMDPVMLLLVKEGFVLVPYLGRLVLIVPLELVVPGGEIPFLCPYPVLISPYSKEDSL